MSFSGYILQNSVAHARLLPAESKHAFTYPTVSVLVGLRSLESRELDLPFRVFGYSRWNVLGLRPDTYLTSSKYHSETIFSKLDRFLRGQGLEGLHDAWMFTMPSYLGVEGINPLTVHFCYLEDSDAVWVIVLEIHNTFGESHSHILRVGVNEDEVVRTGYVHQWTFARSFHVSPFNDRLGTYSVALRLPSSPPGTPALLSQPWPAVSVHLLSPEGPLKLTASIRPIRVLPLTTRNAFNLLSCFPGTLWLSFVRIAWEAWKLHYKKRLDVFIKPAPHVAARPLGGTTRWLSESWSDAFARRRVEKYLQGRRLEDKGITVELVPPNPEDKPVIFEPVYPGDSTLRIHYFSPAFFSLLFTSPSPWHALLVGSRNHHDRLFSVNDEELFQRVFTLVPSHLTPAERSLSQKLRLYRMPCSFGVSDTHPLDTSTSSVFVLLLLHLASTLEQMVFRAFGARVVKGREPWDWGRPV